MAQRLDPKIQQETNKKMSNKNLQSITTRTDGPDDKRSSVNKEKNTALFAKVLDGIMDLTSIENSDLNKIDLESMIEETEKTVLNKKKMLRQKKCTHDTKICGHLL